MNKPMLLAAAMTALSISGGAMALDVSRILVLQIPGFYGRTLGDGLLSPLGRTGEFCDYEMSWGSPFNPNDVVSCLVRESRTPVSPSCVENEMRNIVTTVTAGIGSSCSGFNVKGERFDGVVLLLGESPAGLVGTAIFPLANALPYPITTCGSMI